MKKFSEWYKSKDDADLWSKSDSYEVLSDIAKVRLDHLITKYVQSNCDHCWDGQDYDFENDIVIETCIKCGFIQRTKNIA